jgi:site-specific DNA-methyltransferase (adenine-specific)/modification methylase
MGMGKVVRMLEIAPEKKKNANTLDHQANKAPRLDLRLGDSRELIKQVPDGSVDLILTDPPYNLGIYSTGNMKFTWRAEINNDIADWDTFSFEPSHWKEEFLRILKPTGNIFAFCSYNLLGRWHECFDPVFDTFQFVVWHKTNPTPKIRRAGFLNSCELIVCCWNKGHVWNFTKQNEMHNFIETPICMGQERIKAPKHPTQKPIAVLRKIIEWSTNAGDVVFDPFMGVGSSGAAALRLGRGFVGFEAREDFFSAAVRRLNTERATVLSRLL